MTLALLCSGQGRQDRAMFDILAQSTEAAPILAVAGKLLGSAPADFVATSDDTALHANRAGQILCVARALGVAAGLDLTTSFIVAGYSVGEMAAWGVAGIWPAETTLRLTARRAELMDLAGGADGGLGFIRGLDRPAVERLVGRFDCAIAIVNPDRLFIIGGCRDDIAACCTQALAEGAKGARPIGVTVASHTPRLASAVAPFEAELRQAGGQRVVRGRTLVSALDTRIISDPEPAAPGLARQIATTVNWDAALRAAIERGADRLLELGPGSALADMARAAYPSLSARAVDDFRSIEGVRAWLAR